MTTRLASPPTAVTVGTVSAAALAGVTGSYAEVPITIPVRNSGTHAPAEIRLAGIPEAVAVSEAASSPWTCVDAAEVVCTLPSLPRGATDKDLVLTLKDTEEVIDVTPEPPSSVTVSGPTNASTFSLALTSAPAALEASAAPTTTLQRNVPWAAAVGVLNTGRTTAHSLVATIDLPAGVEWDALDLTGLAEWACTPTPGIIEAATCLLADLAPGGLGADLLLPIRAGSTFSGGSIAVRISADDIPPVTVTSAVQVVTPTLVFSSPVKATLVRGESGQVDFEVQNAGTAVARDVSVTVRVPTAISLGTELAEGTGWECSLESAHLVACDLLGDLGIGEKVALVLSARADAAVAGGTVLVELFDSSASGPVLTGSASVNAPNAGLAPRGQWTGSFGVTEIGAPLLTCDTKVAGCIAARIDIAGTAQNNGFDMVPLAESTSELLIPEDAEVEFAGLYWSANKHTTDELWTGPLTHIELRGPRGVAQTIDDGQKIAEVADNAGRQYYQSYADVTELVQAGGSGLSLIHI